MNMKQEKMKKLTNELKCLQVWLERDMVPKEDLQDHLSQIEDIQNKINEEKNRMLISNDSFVDAMSKLQSLSIEDDIESKQQGFNSDDNVSLFFEDERDAEDSYYDSSDSSDYGLGSSLGDSSSGYRDTERSSPLFPESQEWMHDAGYDRDDL